MSRFLFSNLIELLLIFYVSFYAIMVFLMVIGMFPRNMMGIHIWEEWLNIVVLLIKFCLASMRWTISTRTGIILDNGKTDDGALLTTCDCIIAELISGSMSRSSFNFDSKTNGLNVARWRLFTKNVLKDPEASTDYVVIAEIWKLYY